MKKLMNVCTAAVLIVGSSMVMGTAQAQSNCNTTLNSFEDVYCSSKVFIKADDDLNTVYQRLVKRLGASGQATLRRTQRAWVAGRNSECSEQDSKLGTVISMSCAVDKTTSRTNFLNDRLRECLSSGCQPAKLN
jgi:uncharacterized protein YecT (DUF1311 family)